jgi:hypothetical protein
VTHEIPPRTSRSPVLYWFTKFKLEPKKEEIFEKKAPSKCEAKCCPFLSFSPSEYEAQKQKIAIFQFKSHIFICKISASLPKEFLAEISLKLLYIEKGLCLTITPNVSASEGLKPALEAHLPQVSLRTRLKGLFKAHNKPESRKAFVGKDLHRPSY